MCNQSLKVQAVGNYSTVRDVPGKPCNILINQCTPRMRNEHQSETDSLPERCTVVLALEDVSGTSSIGFQALGSNSLLATELTLSLAEQANPGVMQSPPVGELSEPQKL